MSSSLFELARTLGEQDALSVAQAHKIPVDFECQNGECGSCLVQVSVLSGKTPYGVALTEKEKTVLRYAGKITKEQIEAAVARG